MKVKDLIELLQQEKADWRVVIASDEEGNSFGDIADDFGLHKHEGEEVLAIYPDSNINGLEVE